MSQVSLSGTPNVNLPEPATLDAGLNGGLDSGDGSGGLSFGAVLKNAVDSVNAVNDQAGMQINNLMAGRGGDMSSVMIAVEKADASFQLMMQVRNKIVNAYQDIEKMQF
ncbi:MAG: flagellar hook-basal body complex protein FliE [Acidobacteriaceae bacterium]